MGNGRASSCCLSYNVRGTDFARLDRVLVPLGLLAGLFLLFLNKTPLATEIKHEIPAESLAEGQVLITEFEEDILQMEH